jgi:hypothetical protein
MQTTTKANKANTNEAKTQQTKIDGPNPSDSNREIQENSHEFEPGMDPYDPAATANEDDVTITWAIKVIVGNKTVFLHFKGSSTLNRLLSPLHLPLAVRTVEKEVINKIVIPLASAFQEEITRRALEDAAMGNGGATLT